jgi:hypothetical protein
MHSLRGCAGGVKTDCNFIPRLTQVLFYYITGLVIENYEWRGLYCIVDYLAP